MIGYLLENSPDIDEGKGGWRRTRLEVSVKTESSVGGERAGARIHLAQAAERRTSVGGRVERHSPADGEGDICPRDHKLYEANTKVKTGGRRRFVDGFYIVTPLPTRRYV